MKDKKINKMGNAKMKNKIDKISLNAKDITDDKLKDKLLLNGK